MTDPRELGAPTVCKCCAGVESHSEPVDGPARPAMDDDECEGSGAVGKDEEVRAAHVADDLGGSFIAKEAARSRCRRFIKRMRGSGSFDDSGDEMVVDGSSVGAGTGAGTYGIESDSCAGAPVSCESKHPREIGA